jgi:hypothetical protein
LKKAARVEAERVAEAARVQAERVKAARVEEERVAEAARVEAERVAEAARVVAVEAARQSKEDIYVQLQKLLTAIRENEPIQDLQNKFTAIVANFEIYELNATKLRDDNRTEISELKKQFDTKLKQYATELQQQEEKNQESKKYLKKELTDMDAKLEKNLTEGTEKLRKLQEDSQASLAALEAQHKQRELRVYKEMLEYMSQHAVNQSRQIFRRKGETRGGF